MPKLIPYAAPSVPSGNAGLPYLYAAAGGAARQAADASIDRQNAWNIAGGVANFATNEVGNYLARKSADQQRDLFIQHAESNNPDIAADPHWQMGKAMMMGGASPKDAMAYVEKAREGDALAAYRKTMAGTASDRAQADANYKSTMGGVAMNNANTRAAEAESRSAHRTNTEDFRTRSLDETIRGHNLQHEDRQRGLDLKANAPGHQGSIANDPIARKHMENHSTYMRMVTQYQHRIDAVAAGNSKEDAGQLAAARDMALRNAELERKAFETRMDELNTARAPLAPAPFSVGSRAAPPPEPAPAASQGEVTVQPPDFTDEQILKAKQQFPNLTPEELAAYLRQQ